MENTNNKDAEEIKQEEKPTPAYLREDYPYKAIGLIIGCILPYDEHCASIQADIYARMIKNGTPVSASDAQIAATALANNLIIVTRNIRLDLLMQ